MIRAIIADDEEPARRRLRALLTDATDFSIAAEAANGLAAVEAIERSMPDVLFLDIQMPGLDGFGVIEAIGPERMPAVVFVTAFDQHALRAFEVHALDYLLKPFDAERFARTLDRIRTLTGLHSGNGQAARLRSFLSERADPAAEPRLLVRSTGRVRIIHLQDIDWISAAGNYAELHVGSETHLLHETMAALEERLSTQGFRRVHRSALVRLDRVRELRPGARGDGMLILHNGAQLPYSRNYRHNLSSLLR